MHKMFSWLSTESGNKTIDSVNKIAQLAALVVAGVWTYRTFFQSVQPGLAVRADLTTAVDWAYQHDSSCIGRLSAVVKNPGTTPLNITWIRVRGWLFLPKNLGELSPEKPVYDDETAVEQTNPFFDREFSDDGAHDSTTLVGRFVTGVERNDVWQWYFNKAPGQIAYFRVDAKDGDHKEYEGFSTNVVDVCRDDTEPASPAKSP